MKTVKTLLTILALAAPGLQVSMDGQAVTPEQNPVDSQMAVEKVVLSWGRLVCLSPTQAVSTQTARKGDRVLFRTAKDVMVDDLVVVPKGTEVWSKVSQSRRAGHFHDGKLTFVFDALPLPAGKSVSLRAYTPPQCSGDKATFGEMVEGVMASVILAPAILLGARGEEVNLDQKSCVQQTTTAEVSFNKTDLLPPQPALAAPDKVGPPGGRPALVSEPPISSADRADPPPPARLW
jgi:hypothetical protein